MLVRDTTDQEGDTMQTIRTEDNWVEVRGNHQTSMFAPNFYAPDVWLTDDRLEVRYSLEYGFVVEVYASITRTDDGYVLVGAHSTFNHETKANTNLDPIRDGETTRDALLRYASKVDALSAEFIVPQVREETA